jgi:transposase InsO family protein
LEDAITNDEEVRARLRNLSADDVSVPQGRTRPAARDQIGDILHPDSWKALVDHSDQGTQFTSRAFTRRAIDSGLLPSMGSVGSCYDNAMIESFWSRMQVELLDRRMTSKLSYRVWG